MPSPFVREGVVNRIRLIGLLAVGAAILITGVGLDCALAAPDRRPIGPQPFDMQPRPVDWNTTYVALEMNGSWSDVLAWFAAQTRMAIHSRANTPVGIACGTTPKNRSYSLTEVYDLINHGLQSEAKLTLLRGPTTLTLFPADEEIPAHLVPRVEITELKTRGQTEIVEIVLPLRPGLDALELAPQVKRLLGDCGQAIPSGNNQLILRAHVSTLRKVVIECSQQ